MSKAARDAAMDRRTLARLAAVQALYQMEHAGQGVKAVIREYQNHRLGGEMDGAALRDADDDFFIDLVEGVVEVQPKIDPLIEKQLKTGWTMKRLDATVRAILRCGCFELIRRVDVPKGVVIDEYVTLANDFFEDGSDESKFVNGVLDAAAKATRADED